VRQSGKSLSRIKSFSESSQYARVEEQARRHSGFRQGAGVIAEIFSEEQNKNSIFSNDGKKSVVFEYVVNVDIPNDAPTLE